MGHDKKKARYSDGAIWGDVKWCNPVQVNDVFNHLEKESLESLIDLYSLMIKRLSSEGNRRTEADLWLSAYYQVSRAACERVYVSRFGVLF